MNFLYVVSILLLSGDAEEEIIYSDVRVNHAARKRDGQEEEGMDVKQETFHFKCKHFQQFMNETTEI